MSTASLRNLQSYLAKGFRLEVLKLKILVELLMGNFPEKKIFLSKEFKTKLKLYYLITEENYTRNE